MFSSFILNKIHHYIKVENRITFKIRIQKNNLIRSTLKNYFKKNVNN